MRKEEKNASKNQQKIARVGGGVFKRTIQQKTKPNNSFGLTNRPEFQSQSIAQPSSKRPRNKHEENLPDDGGRLVVRNLDFNIRGEDLEDAFVSFGNIVK